MNEEMRMIFEELKKRPDIIAIFKQIMKLPEECRLEAVRAATVLCKRLGGE